MRRNLRFVNRGYGAIRFGVRCVEVTGSATENEVGDGNFPHRIGLNPESAHKVCVVNEKYGGQIRRKR
jgi:hypothetical protein